MPSSRRTKIVASLGPASDDPVVLRGMLDAGVDVVRLNLSHGPVQDSLDRLARVRAVAAQVPRPVGILADLPGPKVRTASFPVEGAVLQAGSEVAIVDAVEGVDCDEKTVAVDLPGAAGALEPGDVLPLGDGGARLRVTAVEGDRARAVVDSGGVLRGRPGISLPVGRADLRSPTEADLAAIEQLVAAGVDAVAVSFVQSADDMAVVRRAVGHDGPMIVAKIETAAAVDQLDAIVRASDGVMVARGDLGVRLPLEDVPHIQKHIIRTTVRHGKPVITATQMLESMVSNPVPTRAEVTDVANAVFDGTSAVMLSGETAIGHDPVAVIEAMARITRRAEREFDYRGWGRRLGEQEVAGLADAPTTARITAAITAAAWRASVDLDLAAVVACTRSGTTARMISRFRPTCPILAMTPSPRTARQLAMAWGIRPLVMDEHGTTDDIVWYAVETAVADGAVRPGDLVAVLVGSPTDVDPTTDVLRLVRVR
ncbi:MAG: pyruvate kinase [Acidimicrobiia bacterium]